MYKYSAILPTLSDNIAWVSSKSLQPHGPFAAMLSTALLAFLQGPSAWLKPMRIDGLDDDFFEVCLGAMAPWLHGGSPARPSPGRLRHLAQALSAEGPCSAEAQRPMPWENHRELSW